MRGEIKLILPTSWKPNKDDFFANLGVSKGGLGDHFFGSVYDAFFIYAIDVKVDFEKYYSVEYANLANYMEIKYGEFLEEDKLDCDQIFLVTWIPQIVDEHYEDNKFDILMKCIQELERSQNEDQA